MQTLSAEQRRFFEQAASTYQSDLAADTNAQEYLKGRGFDGRAAVTFRLGVVHRPLVGHEGYAGRLAIPYITPTGVVNMRFRCLKPHDCKAEDCPKYLGSDGMDSNLFNVLDLKQDSPFICVTEGELDAATLSMAGLPAVGVPGVETWQKHFSKCLDDFDVIYTFADGDKAGRAFARFLAREAKARPVRLPDGEDVNSLYMKGGADALRRLLTP
ncbi:toprim domain-containing protein [Streptomyces sparsogenes]|uniref:toprim domain-containing protein n=1 Tax=Streptomyces sparsogenes TaxID=67365 RepID=UPI00384C0869